MSEREELERYLELVRAEVARRKDVVGKVEGEIALLQQQLRRSIEGVVLDVGKLKVSTRYKADREDQLAEKHTRLNEARIELEKAEERQKEVLQELRDLGE